ncbi:MAG TPA: hypothetical protein V6D14_17520 [Coleofasciculaceae cyanobacterium]
MTTLASARRQSDRSFSSHSCAQSSVISYLAALVSPLWLVFPDLQRMQWAIDWEKVAAFLVGVELSALNHLLLDGLLLPLPASVKQRLKGN